SGPLAAALAEIRRAVRDVDPAVVVTGDQSMTERMEASVWQQRLLGTWLGMFGALALGMSFIGLYGVVAQIIGQRTRELSVRLALGATPDRVIGSVIREGALLLVIGVVAGAPLAYRAVRAVS